MLRVAKDMGGVVGVEEANNVHAEIALKPDDVGSGAVEHLNERESASAVPKQLQWTDLDP